MKDYKDHATLELPGFEVPAAEVSDVKKPLLAQRRGRGQKQEQLDLLAQLGPTDLSGLPVWENDENKDLTGLPVWR